MSGRRGRPLTGSKKRTATGWEASLPTKRGARTRSSWTFVTEKAADAWITRGIAALDAGDPLPVPDSDDLVQVSRAALVGAGTQFRALAEDWKHERYIEIATAGPSRETAVDGHLRRIADWMEARGLTMETMTREHVKAFQADLTRSKPATEAIALPEGVDPDRLVTLNEGVALTGTPSRSTLKRRIKSGALVAIETGIGAHRYRTGDLYRPDVAGGPKAPDGSLRRGPKSGGALTQNVAADVMWVFDQVCLFAEDMHVQVPQDRKSLPMHRTDRETSKKSQPISIVRCADLAARLHVVHQVALWLMRIMGMRIGEAFGVRVGSIVDMGKYGVLFVKEQGGRPIKERRPGERVVTIADQTIVLKTQQSYRVLVVPPMLMSLIRVVIATFHTNPDGTIRREDRLVPGLQRRNAGGQAAFRAAIARAASEIALTLTDDEVEKLLSVTPHDMRRSILSDLDRMETHGGHARRFGGHAAGADVHARFYVVDDPALRPMKKIAKRIQKELEEQLSGDLLVPTTVSCTTGSQPALALEKRRIDAELVERGWLVLPTDGDDTLIGAAEVADLLGITEQEARRRMADGRIPSVVYSDRARGTERRARLADVLKIKEIHESYVSVRSIAEEFGQQYHTVYQYVIAQGLRRLRVTGNEYVLTEETAHVVRAHYQSQAALHARAMSYSAAAEELGVNLRVLEHMVRDGILVDDVRAHDGRRMVTRASVAEALAERCAPEAVTRSDVLTWQEALSFTGWSDARLNALVGSGEIDRVQYNRRRHVTWASLLRHLAHHDHELLVAVLTAGAEC